MMRSPESLKLQSHRFNRMRETERERERERERQTDRQTDRQTGRQRQREREGVCMQEKEMHEIQKDKVER